MRKAVLLLLLLIAPITGQEVLNQDNLKTTEARYLFGNYEIAIRHQVRINFTRERSNARVKPIWCAAFLDILEKGKVIRNLYFEDIWPLGGKAGFFLPVKQESPKHFILMKYGDYDCRTIIITDEGELFNLGGGSYRIFQNRYLITPREMPDTDKKGEFSIFDLLFNRVLITPIWDDLAKGTNQYPARGGYINLIKFYTSGPELFAGIVLVDGRSLQVLGHPSEFYRIHLATGKMIDAAFNSSIHREFDIDYSNIDMNHQCECVKKLD